MACLAPGLNELLQFHVLDDSYGNIGPPYFVDVTVEPTVGNSGKKHRLLLLRINLLPVFRIRTNPFYTSLLVKGVVRLLFAYRNVNQLVSAFSNCRARAR